MEQIAELGDGGAKRNKFGTTDKTCASPGCEWTVDPRRPSGLCVVCEQKKANEREKEKLKSILSVRGKASLVSCDFRSEAVLHPCPAYMKPNTACRQRPRAPPKCRGGRLLVMPLHAANMAPRSVLRIPRDDMHLCPSESHADRKPWPCSRTALCTVPY